MKSINKRAVISRFLKRADSLQISNRRHSLESDSLVEFFGAINRTPPKNAQTGATVTLSELSLFFSAVILLVITLGLASTSVWVLLSMRYYDLLGIKPDLAFLALPVAILTLPASWLLFAIHNDPQSRRYLSLVLILLIFCIILSILGIYVGFSHKLNVRAGQSLSDPALSGFRDSLERLINRTSSENWDEEGMRLGCCWVDDAKACSNNTTCFQIIVSNLVLQTSLFSGIDCIALFLESCVFLIVTAIFLYDKGREVD